MYLGEVSVAEVFDVVRRLKGRCAAGLDRIRCTFSGISEIFTYLINVSLSGESIFWRVSCGV